MSDRLKFQPGEVICSTVNATLRDLRADDPLIFEGSEHPEIPGHLYARNVRTGELLSLFEREVCRYYRPTDAAQALLDAAGGRMVGLTFRKRSDGSMRVLNAKPPKPSERDPDYESEHNLRLVKSVNDGMGYRSVPLDNVTEIRMNGYRFRPDRGRLIANQPQTQHAA